MDKICYVAKCFSSINKPKTNGKQWRSLDRDTRGEVFPHRLLLLLVFTLLCHMATAIDPPDTSHHLCSKKSDIENFYNDSLYDHQLAKRDIREEESARHRRGRDRSTDRELKKIKVQDDEDDDDVDIDPDLQPERVPPPPPSAPTSAPPAYGSCGACRPRDQLRKHSLEVIKGEILSKLGMTQPPNLAGKLKPEFGMNLLLAKYESDTRGTRNQYQPRRHAHPHSHYQGLQWITPDDDSIQMQGDAPSESTSNNSAGRGNTKDYSDKSNHVRSHLNSSDSRYSDNEKFQEGEVYTEEDDDYHVRTKKVVAFSLPHPKLRHIQPDIQFFQFSEKARTNRVKKVALWVYIRGTETQELTPLPSGTHLNISVYKLYRGPQGRSTESPILLPVIQRITQPIPQGAGAWVNLEYGELEKLVGEWFRTPQTNLGLIINATDRQGTNLAVTSQQQSANLSAVPFLEVYLTDTKKHRTKRTLGLNCNDSSNETRCCRYPLTVDFEEFGWDWIIAPKKYEANFCDGECPMVFMQQYAHTHLAQLSTTPRARTGPCCAPRKLSAISMLYFDSNMNIMFGTLPAMVVDRCGCM